MKLAHSMCARAQRRTPLLPFAWLATALLLLPASALAVPQFARRYGLRCGACHTIIPVLNEQGYMFKRLGYHLPPSLSEGQEAPTISYLVRQEPAWTLSNNLSAIVTDFSFQQSRTTQDSQAAVSSSGFQANTWNSYAAGWIPDTNLFYVTEFDIVVNGSTSPALSNAYFGYAGGNARNSWFVSAGREHLEMGEGTRAAAVYSLASSSPLLFETAAPTNFLLDQAPVGLNAGYTWASSGYKNVLALSAKVTNGDNADGSEVLGVSNKISKDVWVDFDWWYAPESGVSFVDYYGRKQQVQNSGLADEFTFTPMVRRQGVFANYMIDYKLDVLGGYLHSHDDWRSVAGGSGAYFTANDFFFEADYYMRPGFALVGRYDLLRQGIGGNFRTYSTHAWATAVNKNLTRMGNVVGRLAYGFTDGRDPVMAVRSHGYTIDADVMFNY